MSYGNVADGIIARLEQSLEDAKAQIAHDAHRARTAEAALDAADRQIAARTGETAAGRLFKERALEAEARIKAVRELHTPREEQVVTGDCSIEECDHEDECPTVPFRVCTECWRVADEADTYFAERGVGHVAYPCPTIRALDGSVPPPAA